MSNEAVVCITFNNISVTYTVTCLVEDAPILSLILKISVKNFRPTFGAS